ncbi:hypothetical protein SAMN05444920_104431 [Nonomuraea solani]|uniref:DUF6745 domain-containing protein n=1 Tax=Nonomuraea solani TaxID=1144553 RepID=A0A1H6CVD2_9ACTN|nr:hypothetical protein SAMN05444920_104431 [Nonomuraea solani]
MQREAAAIREQWLGRALSTQPTDRPAAEAAISALYRLIGLPPPRFHWVSSPLMALATVPPGARQSAENIDDWPLPAEFTSLKHRLSRELDCQVGWVHRPNEQLLRQQVLSSLNSSFNSAFLPPLLQAHSGVSWRYRTWYDTPYVAWLAHYDALHRAAGVPFSAGQHRRLALWTAVASACHWWWPGEQVCVVSERPVAVHTEVWGDDGEVRLHHADGPALRYGDGWDLYAWHGTQVPPWVLEDPAIDRIANEPNVEVRRCAIERLGWGPYIEQAGLRLVATAPDPGNPGFELRLYDMRRDTKVLLAINGSVERDGHRRRYGLTVPGFLKDPVDAAGWTYGLSAEQYSLLQRRT